MRKLIMMCISLSSISSSASVLSQTYYNNNYLYSGVGDTHLSKSDCANKFSPQDIEENTSLCEIRNTRHKDLITKEVTRFHMPLEGLSRCYDQYSQDEFNAYKPKHIEQMLLLKENKPEVQEFLRSQGYSKTFICLEMEKLREHLIPIIVEKIQDTNKIYHFKKYSVETSILNETSFSRSYGAESCGLVGTVEERIKDCSIYPGATRGTINRVSNLKVSDRINSENIYLDTKTNIFWSEKINSSTAFSNLVTQLWRKATSEDLDKLPKDQRGRFTYISAAPIEGLLQPYSSTLKNRKTGDAIIFDYKDGVADVYLMKKNGEKELIKTFSLSMYPVEHFGNRFYNSGYRRVRSISEGYYDLTTGMARTMDMGMFAFFPVTLTIYGVYSLSYGPAYLLDLVGPERRSVRKMDKLLRGISSKTGDKSFNLVLETFEESNLN